MTEINSLQVYVPFVGSHGWLYKFMARYSISLRRKITVSQQFPGDLDAQIVNYMVKVRKLHLKNKYPVTCIIAMNEVALWMDMPASTTLDIWGTCSIPIKITGHEKSRFIVCLAA